MALVIGKKNTRKIRAQIEEQGDFNEVKKHNVDVEFKILSPADLKEIEAYGTQGSENFDPETQAEMIFDQIVSVDGLKDEAGNPIPYSPDVRKHMIETLWIRHPILKGFWSVQIGISQADTYKQAKLKN